MQNLGLKRPVQENLETKSILSTHNLLCWKFAVICLNYLVCWKFATSCTTYFLTHNAAVVKVQIDKFFAAALH